MVGIVIVCHCELADAFYHVVKTIVGDVENIRPVCIDPSHSHDQAFKQVSQAIAEVERGDGVLIVTDMFGGSPSNVSLSFLEDDKVEVLTGINLPMLVRLISMKQEKKKLKELAHELKTYGQKNICIASELLKIKNKP